mmetsp:Transcript_28756/g.63305  ORF Transcript_28756/g.63305 Transcript_28756/m.63305 type:complete len:277 (-) Transcript_28756:71-901(-)
MGAIAPNTETDNLLTSVVQHESVFADRGSSRGRRTGATGLDNGGAASLHTLGEVGQQPLVVVYQSLDGQSAHDSVVFHFDTGEVHDWHLGCGMVAQNEYAFHKVGVVHLQLFADESGGAGVVEHSQAAEVLFGDGSTVDTGDQCVGIARVSHNNYFAGRFGVVECLALYNKNFGVLLQQVVALHAWAARFAAHEQCIVQVLERQGGVVEHRDSAHQIECTVYQLHFDCLSFALEWRQVQQVQHYGLICPEGLPRSYLENKRVSNIACCSSHTNFDG